MINYRYCPQCKTWLTKQGKYPYCTNCDLTIYLNPKPCASVMPIRKGKVLIGTRNQDPFKGTADLVGGFLEYGEGPQEAAIRETREESGLDIKIKHLLSIHSDTYGKAGESLIIINYIAEVVGGKLKTDDDIAELRWVDIDKLPIEKAGFNNVKKAMLDLQNWYKKNRYKSINSQNIK